MGDRLFVLENQGEYDLMMSIWLDTALKILREEGVVCMNRWMAIHAPRDGKSGVFVRKKEPVFPFYHESDIRVSRFPDGRHFYVYVGKAEVRDGNIVKWDTYEEAYNAAQQILYK